MPIVKILARHSPTYGALLHYITKADKGKDQNPPRILTHNIRGTSIKEMEREFMENETFRRISRADQVYLFHEIVSMSALDKETITEDLLLQVAEQYIALRGREGVYVAALHADKDHYHWHFAVSSLEYRTGKAFRVSPKELHELKVNLEAFTKQFPELQHSHCNHGSGREYVTDREWHARQKPQRNLIKEEIQEKVKDLFVQSKTQQEFLQQLTEAGIPHYERNGIPTGIVHESGMKFRFSRLDIDKEELQQLPVDRTEEERVLEEIRSIREEIQGREALLLDREI